MKEKTKDIILICLFLGTCFSPFKVSRIIGGIYPIVIMVILALITFYLATKWTFDDLGKPGKNRR